MKVYFDARMISHPGIGRYIKCLLAELIKDSRLECFILGRREAISQALGPQENILEFDYPVYSLWEQFGFLKFRKAIKKAILHVPHYNIPTSGGFPLVVTIHDLIHLSFPQGASSFLAPWYMKAMVGRSLVLAKRIICVSQATRKLLMDNFAAEEAKITVIPEAAGEVFQKISDEDFLQRVRKKYCLPDKFILYVGSIRRHKNIDTLLKSYKLLRSKRPEIYLVLAGKVSQGLDLRQEGLILLEAVRDDRELAALYTLATVFCNLSLYEGFSLTILEAQQCLLPVVASNIPAHRETGGEGFIAVDALEWKAITGRLLEVVEDGILRSRLIEKGRENLSRFSWKITAERTIKLYQQIQ